MTSPVTIKPNGNGSQSGVWGGTGSPGYDYSQVADGSDGTYITVTSNSSYIFYLLDDLPADVSVVTGVDWSFRCTTSAKTPARSFSTIQIFKSDETTALTNTGDVSGGSTALTTLTGSLSITGSTDKASWDGARIKITSASTGSGSAGLTDVSLSISYTTASGAVGRIVGRGMPGRVLGNLVG